MLRKIGLLLVNLGTPDAPTRSAVNRYLKEFLLDRRVVDIPWLKRQLLVRGVIIPMRAGNSTALYQRLWTEDGSPLLHYGQVLRDALQEQMGPNTPVALGMRYQNPSIESALNELYAQSITELIVFPLYPHYASSSTGSALEEVLRLVGQREVIPSMTVIQDYYDHPDYIDVMVKHSKAFDLDSYDHVLFSYHGIPMRQLEKADPKHACTQSDECNQHMTMSNRNCYSGQSYATTRALVQRLGLQEGQYSSCFQSRIGKDPWTKPYAAAMIADRAAKGDRRILVFSPAFVADCLETTVEVGYEYQEVFEKAGGEKLDLVPSLNDDPDWVQTISTIIQERVKL